MLYFRRFVLYCFILMGLFVIVTIGVVAYERERFSDTRVVFLDVGQGDAILFSEGSYQVLIDGGPDGRKLLEEIGRYIPFWDRRIEVVVATHPDGDHIDGLVDLVQNYTVERFFATGIEKDTSVYTALMRNLRNRDVEIGSAERGLQFTFPSGSSYEVIYPFVKGDENFLAAEPNNTSISGIISIRAEEGSDPHEKFFIGGDLHAEIEDLLPLDDSITVLKAGHHGSGTSTSQKFLNTISPRDVIFSVGRNNRYNHPKNTVVDRVRNFGSTIYRTDQQGNIQYLCDNSCHVFTAH